jgi:2-desacetyl-2-hydroxyethyl bacteriochlorophyllide A dehydrogenase
MNTLPHSGGRLVMPRKNAVIFETFDLPPPAAGEVLVETACSLLSTGTETLVFSGNFQAGTHWDAWVRYPFRPGYASVGFVVATGEGVETLTPGDRIVTRCGHASHAILKAENGFRIPDAVKSEDAVWFALAKIAGHGIRAAGLSLGDSVAVIGTGPIGQMAVRWALASGASHVLAVDLSPERLALANAAGAVPVLAPAAEAQTEVLRILGGRPGVVIDSTGNAEVLKSAFRMVEKEGTVVLLGDTGTPESQSLTGDVISRGLRLVGAHDGLNSPRWNNRVAAKVFFQFLRTGRFPTPGLVTHRFQPSQCAEAYELAVTNRSRTMGILFEWNAITKATDETPADADLAHV